MNKKQNNQKDDKALYIDGVVSNHLIKFNEVDADGNMYLPNSINIESLNRLKVRGQIKDFEVDENGVKVIKDFRLESVGVVSV